MIENYQDKKKNGLISFQAGENIVFVTEKGMDASGTKEIVKAVHQVNPQILEQNGASQIQQADMFRAMAANTEALNGDVKEFMEAGTAPKTKKGDK